MCPLMLEEFVSVLMVNLECTDSGIPHTYFHTNDYMWYRERMDSITLRTSWFAGKEHLGSCFINLWTVSSSPAGLEDIQRLFHSFFSFFFSQIAHFFQSTDEVSPTLSIMQLNIQNIQFHFFSDILWHYMTLHWKMNPTNIKSCLPQMRLISPKNNFHFV